MDIKVSAAHPANVDALIIFLGENADSPPLDSTLNQVIDNVIKAGDFSGKTGQITVLYPHETSLASRVILVGTGEETLDTIRQAAAAALQKARDLKAKTAAIIANGDSPQIAEAIAEGAQLGLYSYHGQKTADKLVPLPETLTLVIGEATSSDIEAAVRAGTTIASGTNLARDLVNLPANICTPAYLAQAARDIGEAVSLKVDVLGRKQMEALNMGALLGVAQGSENPPQFIIMEHNADKAEELDTIVLVGKGVTFDTGGYSLKTHDGMVGMKADMGGGGAVIGAMQAIAVLDIPLQVVGLIPASDNMVSSTAYRPQDVLTASNGVTIEIISTDAEGRLLLADALVFAARYKPAAVVDIATLTGACVTALGTSAAGLFSNNDSLRDMLMAASERTTEKIWPLPLFPEYDKAIESLTADIKNTGGPRGGVGTSAAFLQRFVDYPAWAHLDIAGVAGIESLGGSSDSPYVPAKGATGFGVRLMTDFVRNWQNRS